MDSNGKSQEILTFRVSTEQKSTIKRIADLSNKSLSDFIRDAVLTTTLDSAKSEFYQSINSDLTNIKKSLWIANTLLLKIGAEQMQNNAAMMDFYKEIKIESEEIFGKD